jgi:chromosome partitioning protein
LGEEFRNVTSIAIMNTEGGVGKSRLTMAIPAPLTEHNGRSALVIDADRQMSISLMMARVPVLSERREANRMLISPFIAEVLDEAQIDWPHYVLRDISDVADMSGLYLIRGDMHLPLHEREVAVADRLASLRAFARALLDAARQYVDVVLVDCAPGISVMTETRLRECDHHVIPVKPDFLAVTGLEYVRRFR